MANRCSFDFLGIDVLVTGGTSGIGLATASAFADAGATVTVTGTRQGSADYDTALDRFAYFQLDLRDDEAVDRLAGGVSSLDVLVNNAGANFPDGKDEWDPEGFSAALDLNVAGRCVSPPAVVRCWPPARCPAVQRDQHRVDDGLPVDDHRARLLGGQGSPAGPHPEPGRPLGGDCIRVNAVAPGLIDTPMTAPMQAFDGMVEAELSKVAIQRMGRPDEVAAAVLFLASDASAYTTGSVLAVDGGYLAL